MNLNKENIIDVIKNHWLNLTGCTIEDFNSGINFILDSENSKLENTKKIKEEICVLNFKNGGTIINVADECFSELKEIIQNFGVNDEKIGQLLQKKYKGILVSYYSVRSYIFNCEKLVSIDQNVRKLKKSEKKVFDDFMGKCTENERYNVYMDFETDFHNFYAYFYEDNIVAIGEYSKIHGDDEVVSLSIIVKEGCRGKGYGKAVVNAMTHKIIEASLVPQYRADPKNIASINLAKSLGYEELINGFSLSIKQN
ncbi:GNAT family N-acetyltransferase [Candidatus Gracilibacteria bacterium]|nr:GNAT family N-acetyltransferase [Candidatus Gracilibacteria bacterium]